MRADRLLSILLLLQVNRRVTAAELSRRLEVSPRTIHRDMEALSAAGVPVYAERGRNGGWFLADAYRTDLTGLTPEEAQALFLMGPPHLLDDLGLRRASEVALVKLLAALPRIMRRDAEHIRQRIYIDSPGWFAWDEDVSLLPKIQAALWQERRLLLNYQRSDGSEVERRVDPLGLVAKGSVWYLIAAAEGRVRTYRVSRVRRLTTLDEPVARPPGFDLAGYWQQSRAEFLAALPRYEATLRLAPEAPPWALQAWRFARVERAEPPGEDGWATVRVRFETEEEACACVLGLGPDVEVVEPIALRDRVRERAAAVVARYGVATGAG